MFDLTPVTLTREEVIEIINLLEDNTCPKGDGVADDTHALQLFVDRLAMASHLQDVIGYFLKGKRGGECRNKPQ